MKKYKPLKYLPLYLLFSISQPAHATLWEKAERWLDNRYVRGALRSIPYVGDAFSVLAEERLESKVDHIKDAIFYLQGSGIRTVAATEKSETSLYDVDLTGGLAVIMGSEGKGISKSVLSTVDQSASLPLLGKINSLNVSVACGVFLYEIVRQRQG